MGNRSGAVLIMVLIIMAAVVVGVITVEEMASKDYDYSQSLYVDNQANFYIHSAIKVAKKLLEDDKTRYDSKKDIWATLTPFKADSNTVISMRIDPMNAKININNIVNKNLKLVVRTQRAAEKIFKDNGDNPPKLFKELLRWMLYKKGADEGYPPEYHPIRGSFYSLKEIDFVQSMEGFSERYHNYFTASRASGKININFASEEIIKAYLPEISSCAEEIIKYREKKPFKNITQIRKVGCVSDKAYLDIQRYITTSSSLFCVRIDVEINGMHRYATAVLERRGSSVRTVKYFTGKGYYE